MPRIRASVFLLAVLVAIGRPALAQQTFGTVIIQVRPPNAEILIDGVKWAGSDPSQPLSVQLAPGAHRIEISSPGRETFVRDLTIKAGETIPLNVSLTTSEPASTRPKIDPASQPPPSPQPRPRVPSPSPPPPRAPQPSPGQGVRFVPNEDGPMFAPDVKFTEINGQYGTLIGGYGGMTYGGKFFVGAGAYFQVDGYNGRHLNYFGPVFEYRLFETKAIGLNLHTLIGGGVEYGSCCYPVGLPPYYGPVYGFSEGFFVFEPEAQLVVRFSPLLRLQFGLGYRVTSGYNHDGVSGSFSVQFGR